MDDFERDVARAVSQLAALDAAVGHALRDGVERGAAILRSEAERRAPRRTGNLLRSSVDEPVTSTATTAVHRVAFRAFYARFVDRGHPVRSKIGIVGQAAPKWFLSGPASQLRDTRIANAVRETVSERVAQAIARYNR